MSWALSTAQKSTFFAPIAHMLQFRKNEKHLKDLGRGRVCSGITKKWRAGPWEGVHWAQPKKGRSREAACKFFFLEKESGAISWFVSFANIWIFPQRADRVGGWYCSIVKWGSMVSGSFKSKSLVWQNNPCVLSHKHGRRGASTAFPLNWLCEAGISNSSLQKIDLERLKQLNQG